LKNACDCLGDLHEVLSLHLIYSQLSCPKDRSQNDSNPEGRGRAYAQNNNKAKFE
jgi:hypothetical protein